MEGAGLFNMAGNGQGDASMLYAVHTRKIVDPMFGAKLTGSAGRFTFGSLTAIDQAPGRTETELDPLHGREQLFQVARAQIDSIEKALDQYRLDMRRYPSAEEGLNALLVKPGEAAAWNGPYLKKAVPADPWGRPYVYRTPGEKSEFQLLSYGRDGKPGGNGEDADIGIN